MKYTAALAIYSLGFGDLFLVFGYLSNIIRHFRDVKIEKIKRFLAVIIAGIMGITFVTPTFAEEAADEKTARLKSTWTD